MNVYKSGNSVQITSVVKHEIMIFGDKVINNPSEYGLKSNLEIAKNLLDKADGFYDFMTPQEHWVALSIIRSVGSKWQITEEIYNEALGMLPPISCKNGFMISESMRYENGFEVRGKYTKIADKYWFEIVYDDGSN
ncbi:hypothetical protein [Photobacterium damselae]|uniref:hypothetical protein n=1 Tax=Photobacterium damselae TaxID=38293 RepID=UPI00406946F2